LFPVGQIELPLSEEIQVWNEEDGGSFIRFIRSLFHFIISLFIILKIGTKYFEIWKAHFEELLNADCIYMTKETARKQTSTVEQPLRSYWVEQKVFAFLK
jgi:hypothetical protein